MHTPRRKVTFLWWCVAAPLCVWHSRAANPRSPRPPFVYEYEIRKIDYFFRVVVCAAEPLGVGSIVVSPTLAMLSQSAAPDDVERVWPHGLGELPTWVSVAMRVPANAAANAGFVFYAVSHQVRAHCCGPRCVRVVVRAFAVIRPHACSGCALT